MSNVHFVIIKKTVTVSNTFHADATVLDILGKTLENLIKENCEIILRFMLKIQKQLVLFGVDNNTVTNDIIFDIYMSLWVK